MSPGEKASVREGLEAKRDELVKKYTGERDALLDDLLPTVSSPYELHKFQHLCLHQCFK